MSMNKPHRKNFRFSDLTIKRLEEIAARRELVPTLVIEQLIKEEAEKEGIETELEHESPRSETGIQEMRQNHKVLCPEPTAAARSWS
jgi:hypothetical protein